MTAALKLLSSVGAFPIFLSGVNNPVVILRSACGIDLLDRVDSPVFCLVWDFDLGPGTVLASSRVTLRFGPEELGPGGTSWILGVVPGDEVSGAF
jgi:hypothetical protein